MFGSSFATGPIERKPTWKWFFKDNNLTGIVASKDYEGAFDGIILPWGLTDEQRDLVLWAYEAAYIHGRYDGKRALKRDLCNLIGAVHV